MHTPKKINLRQHASLLSTIMFFAMSLLMYALQYAPLLTGKLLEMK